MLFRSEQPRTRIARLRQRRDRADLDEAEAEMKKRVGNLGVLVEARRKADRIGEVQPEGPHCKPRIVRLARKARRELEALDGESVGVFGIKRPQQWPREAVEEANHMSPRMRARTLSAGWGLFKAGLDIPNFRL